MSNYYLVDPTVKNKQNKSQSATYVFPTIPALVTHLEGTCQRKFGKSRKEYMFDMENIGYGADDSAGRVFVESLSEYFNIGVIRADSTPIRTNIFDADRFSKNKESYGD